MLGRIRSMTRRVAATQVYEGTWVHLTHTCWACGQRGHQREDPECEREGSRPERGGGPLLRRSPRLAQRALPVEWPPPPAPAATRESSSRKRKRALPKTRSQRARKTVKRDYACRAVRRRDCAQASKELSQQLGQLRKERAAERQRQSRARKELRPGGT